MYLRILTSIGLPVAQIRTDVELASDKLWRRSLLQMTRLKTALLAHRECSERRSRHHFFIVVTHLTPSFRATMEASDPVRGLRMAVGSPEYMHSLSQRSRQARHLQRFLPSHLELVSSQNLPDLEFYRRIVTVITRAMKVFLSHMKSFGYLQLDASWSGSCLS